MDPLQEARMLAMGTPVCSPPYEVAVALCRLRGLEPNGMHLAGMLNWQAVIAEQLIVKVLDRVMSL